LDAALVFCGADICDACRARSRIALGKRLWPSTRSTSPITLTVLFHSAMRFVVIDETCGGRGLGDVENGSDLGAQARPVGLTASRSLATASLIAQAIKQASVAGPSPASQ